MQTTALRQVQGLFSIRAIVGAHVGVGFGAASSIYELSLAVGRGAIRAQLGSDLRISHRRRNGCVTRLRPAATTENGERIVNVYLQSAGINDSLHL